MTGVKEFLFGGKRESLARETVASLGQKGRLIRREETALADAKSTLRNLTIRRVGLAASIGILALGSIGIHRNRNVQETNTQVYQGDILFLQGKSLMDEGEFTTLTSTLQETSSPLLKKIARDLTRLHFEETNHPDLPEWINEDSSPLPITQDDARISYAVSFSRQVKLHDSPIQYKLQLVGTTHELTPREVKDVSIGIHLGANDKDNRLFNALALAKEHMSHMFSLRMALDWGQINEKDLVYIPQDLEGRRITKRADLDKIGINFFYLTTENPEIITHRIPDAAPTLLLTNELIDMTRRGEVNLDDGSWGIFHDVALLLLDDQIGGGKTYETASQLINSWVSQDRLLPPRGSTQRVLTEPLYSKMEQVFDIMWPQVTPTP